MEANLIDFFQDLHLIRISICGIWYQHTSDFSSEHIHKSSSLSYVCETWGYGFCGFVGGELYVTRHRQIQFQIGLIINSINISVYCIPNENECHYFD